FNNELIHIDTIMWAESLDGFFIETVMDSNRVTVVGAGALPDGTNDLFGTVRITLDENIDESFVVLLEKFRINENPVISNSMIGLIMLSVGDEAVLPTEYQLRQNFPNPFNPVTTIRYDLPEISHVRIDIYDILGREVATLVNRREEAGYRAILWDGTDNSGRVLGSGVYFYQINATNYTKTKKMLLIK
ncbi:MAG: T9SS type A sorting domain-containing protein, partial [Candidatus Marinimicrobia bacterium]|nr:T9SS type A sorting domain-containing protein [Candidatus Neomarinimicrobiota bacterium]